MKTFRTFPTLFVLGLLTLLSLNSCSRKEDGLQGHRYKDLKDKVTQQNASLAVLEDEIRELTLLVQQNNRELNKLQITQESLRTRIDVGNNQPSAQPVRNMATTATTPATAANTPAIISNSSTPTPPNRIDTSLLNQPFTTSSPSHVSSPSNSRTSTPDPYPTETTPPSSSSTAVPLGGTYTVRSGDTFSKIASKHGVTMSTLRSVNPRVNVDRIAVGMKLRLPSSSKPASSARNSNSSSSTTRIEKITYRVRTGDNLSKIARQYGVSITTIKSYNPRLDPNRIAVGQKIIIPVRKKTSSYSAPRPTSAPAVVKAPSTHNRNYQVAHKQIPQAEPVYSGPKKMIRITHETNMGQIARDFSTSVRTLNGLNSVTLGDYSKIPGGSLLYVPAR